VGCSRGDNTNVTCFPTAGTSSSPVPGPATRTVDVAVTFEFGDSVASGRAVTIRRQ